MARAKTIEVDGQELKVEASWYDETNGVAFYTCSFNGDLIDDPISEYAIDGIHRPVVHASYRRKGIVR